MEARRPDLILVDKKPKSCVISMFPYQVGVGYVRKKSKRLKISEFEERERAEKALVAEKS